MLFGSSALAQLDQGISFQGSCMSNDGGCEYSSLLPVGMDSYYRGPTWLSRIYSKGFLMAPTISPCLLQRDLTYGPL